ncbi:MAG: hypothetical protein KJ950_11845 [Proteobacteria bacterium]|nr:hypothetical protein [Pseudomonadota bacterium]
MTRKLIAVCVVVLIIFTTGSALAKMSDQGMRGDAEKGTNPKGTMSGVDITGHLVHMVHLLDLTDEQKKAIETIHFAHRKNVVRKTADIDITEIELQEILANEPIKIEAAEKKIRAQASLGADLEILRLKTNEAIKATLTHEQLKNLKDQMLVKKKNIAKKMSGKMAAKMKKKGMGKSDESNDNEENVDGDNSEEDNTSQTDPKEEASHH